MDEHSATENGVDGEEGNGEGNSDGKALRRGWTTGACATAAARAACGALFSGDFPDPVTVTLPGGQTPAFALAWTARGDGWAAAGVVKDAGDDPDVTHGALIRARVSRAEPGQGVVFRAGEGVGTVTRPGLPVPVGEPAINPVPRAMIRQAVAEAAALAGEAPDAVVEVSVDNGEALARRTMNPRLGILGGLSILGTTGIVVPYSCAAWIASIQRGVDVARAAGLGHVAACTGDTSEKAVVARYGLPEHALLDMGDFAGGTLKYLRRHPIPRLTLCGGFAKFGKLARGLLDLHSKRGSVDLDWLADRMAELGAAPDTVAEARAANTAAHVLAIAKEAGLPLADRVAALAQRTALDTLDGAPVAVEVLVTDRQGNIVGTSGWAGP
ncbi:MULTISPECIES: cobalt-precorrin-5B (C(1))-methyltransferase [Azospirillum]|uniref:Cobalt-precorrin-5B C(1)-methyltransferase n=1 Tax=Azospirillum brasilense TaxID=192 RepID=A0ABU4P2R8_AZOBR|nr:MULTISPECIES: cobalt-precorrin-5B (C(1))-methyltransferase [Azospirillum]MDW7555888.1 cobalt-precorrin-5B (C(1))-methyltransferase [Azospirillum brasilense]MDW7595965.1 cobalt-precorrin-5B (C(1))-methyltransferase [Azospirillum brasilense]MDW7630970.1 cobalt-precorrin-5B (C(1))-methyltransferase [Azospirillum brasilense]MDX5951576.1 cobalt-precorrin-5B (C(1))-methyltransferase [Azospirillum brasilense]